MTSRMLPAMRRARQHTTCNVAGGTRRATWQNAAHHATWQIRGRHATWSTRSAATWQVLPPRAVHQRGARVLRGVRHLELLLLPRQVRDSDSDGTVAERRPHATSNVPRRMHRASSGASHATATHRDDAPDNAGQRRDGAPRFATWRRPSPGHRFHSVSVRRRPAQVRRRRGTL